MNITASPSDAALTKAAGPSFATALCGFLSTTAAATVVMFLLSSV